MMDSGPPSVPPIFDDFKFENCPARQYVTQCKSGEFMCKDSLQCIPEALKCDLANDCCDSSDEDASLCYKYEQMTFNFGIGKWKQETDDDADWQIKKPQRYSYVQEPLDHTTGGASAGDYLIFETSGNARYSASISYAMKQPKQNCLMRLWYTGVFTKGRTSGTLNVYVHTGVSSRTKLATVQANTKGWTKLEVPIKVTTSYKILLEATGGLTLPSGISVDDISFTPGCNMGSPTPPPTYRPPTYPATQTTSGSTMKTTPPTAITTATACSGQFQCTNSKECLPLSKKCDFNSDCLDKTDEAGCHTKDICGFTRDSCGWKSSSTSDQIYWVRDTPSGAEKSMAPSYDADFNEGTHGYFMYLLDMLGTQTSKQSATLTSLTFNGAASGCTIDFSFFTQGSNPSLSLYVVSGGKKYILWSSQTSKDTWQKSRVSIGRRRESFSLAFVKALSNSYNGKTAVDNIKFSMCAEPVKVDVCVPETSKFSCMNKACVDIKYKCNGQDDCGDNSDERTALCENYAIFNFDRGFTGMKQTKEDSLDWSLWSRGSKPAIGLPAIDHTSFSSSGQYAYTVANKPGDSAWLLSPNWVMATSKSFCRGSVFVMLPNPATNFSFGQRTHNSGLPDDWIQYSKPTGSIWSFVDFTLDSDKPFQMIFKVDFAEAGSSAAIDDFIMSPDCIPSTNPLPNLKCPSTMFECQTNFVCIEMSKKCDHTQDCSDGSDERDCGWTSTQPSTTMPVITKLVTTTGAAMTQKSTPAVQQTPEKGASTSGKSESWKTPVGVVVGLVAVLTIIIGATVYLKKNQRLQWLRMPSMRAATRNRGMENPLYEYGQDGSASASDFQLDDMSQKNPDEIFGDSTKLGVGFDNPLCMENSESTAA